MFPKVPARLACQRSGACATRCMGRSPKKSLLTQVGCHPCRMRGEPADFVWLPQVLFMSKPADYGGCGVCRAAGRRMRPWRRQRRARRWRRRACGGPWRCAPPPSATLRLFCGPVTAGSRHGPRRCGLRGLSRFGTAVPRSETRSGDCGGRVHAGGFKSAFLPKLCCSSLGDCLVPFLRESRNGKRQHYARPTLQAWARIVFYSCACPVASVLLALRRLAIPVSGWGGCGAWFSCSGAGARTLFTMKAFAAKRALL